MSMIHEQETIKHGTRCPHRLIVDVCRTSRNKWCLGEGARGLLIKENEYGGHVLGEDMGQNN